VALSVLLVSRAEVRQAIFLDRSGSMKPYYQDGLVLDIARTIHGTLKMEGSTEIFAFSTGVTSLSSIEQVTAVPYGDFTYLDRAIDKAIGSKESLLWMITDNVQEQPGAAEAGNTEVFYRRLRSDEVRKVTVFPLLQPPGRGGLVLYALLLDDSAGPAFERGVAEFHRWASGRLQTEPMRMKPLDEETVQVTFVRAAVGPKGSATIYSISKPLREHLEIRFKSRFDHLEIEEGGIRVAEAEPRFDSDSLLVPEQRRITVTPQVVKNLAAGDETEQVYMVDIDMGKLRLKKDIASLWRAAWGKPVEEAKLRLEFMIDVPQGNFRLRPQFLKRYHATSLQEAKETGRVYALDQLPRLMSERVTSVRVVTPIVFRVRYPWWPSMFWIMALLAAGGALVLGGRALKGVSLILRKDWLVRAETDRGAPLECITEEANVLVERDLIGVIRRNTFLPASGVKLEGSAGTAQIRSGMRLRVTTARRGVVLVFEEKKAGAQAAAAYQPKRR
jgi:hypothetical protein